MGHSSGRTWCVALLIVGCSAQHTFSPRRIEIHGLKPTIADSSRPLRQFVPSDESLRASRALEPGAKDGGGCVVAGGVRVSDSGEFATEVTEPPLLGGSRVPARLGGGYLFWNRSALYFAATPLGKLTAVAGFRDQYVVWRVSYGPDYALVHLDEKVRLAWSMPARKPIALPVPGLLDVAGLGDGRAAMLVEPGRLMARGAGRSDWHEDPSAQRLPLLGALYANEDELWHVTADGRAVRFLSANGTFVETATSVDAIRRRLDVAEARRSSIEKSPLEAAVNAGLPLGDDAALVIRDGRVLRVLLRNGVVVGTPTALPTGSDSCELVPAANEPVAICLVKPNRVVVVGRLLSGNPRTEIVFDKASPVFVGQSGILIKSGSCHGDDTNAHASLCRRNDMGDWLDVTLPKAKREAGEQTPEGPNPPDPSDVVYWLTTSKGVIVGLVSGKVPGLYRPETKQFRAFAKHRFSDRIARARNGTLIADNLSILDDDSIVGYTQSSSLRLWPDGHTEEAAHRFSRLRWSGTMAVAQGTRAGSLWQSVDYGQTWQAIASPPGLAARSNTLQSGSRVGQSYGSWYRIGYRTDEAAEPTWTTALAAPLLTVPPAPRIECVTAGTVSTKVAARKEPFLLELGARAIHVNGDQPTAVNLIGSDVRGEAWPVATLHLPVAKPDNVEADHSRWFSQRVRLRYALPLSEPKIRENLVSWRDLAGNDAPARELTSALESAQHVPVLTKATNQVAGMLVFQGWQLVWLREKYPPTKFRLTAPFSDDVVESAYAPTDHELVLLTTAPDNGKRILSITATGVRQHYVFPARDKRYQSTPHPDALAIGENGSYGWLRIPSLHAPSDDSPALVLLPNGASVPLAPWSRLTASASCNPGADAVRSVVSNGHSWYELSVAGAPADPNGTSGFSVLRWGRDAICLETVDVGYRDSDFTDNSESVSTRVVADFGTKAWASHYGFAPGIEFVEPLSCQLVSRSTSGSDRD